MICLLEHVKEESGYTDIIFANFFKGEKDNII